MSAKQDHIPPRLVELVEVMRKLKPGEYFSYGAINLNRIYEAQFLAGIRVTARLEGAVNDAPAGIKTWRVSRYE